MPHFLQAILDSVFEGEDKEDYEPLECVNDVKPKCEDVVLVFEESRETVNNPGQAHGEEQPKHDPKPLDGWPMDPTKEESGLQDTTVNVALTHRGGVAQMPKSRAQEARLKKTALSARRIAEGIWRKSTLARWLEKMQLFEPCFGLGSPQEDGVNSI